MTSHRAVLLAAAVLAVGCAGGVRRVPHAAPFPARIAVLPMDNQTNSLAGPVLLRRLLRDDLVARGIAVTDERTDDEALRRIGITDGGQFRSITPAKVAEALYADGLLYAELTSFSFLNIGVIRKRTVEVRLRLVDPASGTVLWHDEAKESSSKLVTKRSEIGESFLGGLAEKTIEGALKSPLRPESEAVAAALGRRLARAREVW